MTAPDPAASTLGDDLRALIRRPMFGWHPEGCDCHDGLAHGSDETDPLWPLAQRADALATEREGWQTLRNEWRQTAYDLAAERDAARAEVDTLRMLVRDLYDPDPCEFDHRGGCQAHGYLTLEPGQTCPQHDAQQVVALLDPAHAKEPTHG